jgi:hypothetical protein
MYRGWNTATWVAVVILAVILVVLYYLNGVTDPDLPHLYG